MNPEELSQAFGKRTALVILGLIAAFAVLNAASNIVSNIWIEKRKLETEKTLETNRVSVNQGIE